MTRRIPSKCPATPSIQLPRPIKIVRLPIWHSFPFKYKSHFSENFVSPQKPKTETKTKQKSGKLPKEISISHFTYNFPRSQTTILMVRVGSYKSSKVYMVQVQPAEEKINVHATHRNNMFNVACPMSHVTFRSHSQCDLVQSSNKWGHPPHFSSAINLSYSPRWCHLKDI